MEILIFKDKKSADAAITILGTNIGLPKNNKNAQTGTVDMVAKGTDVWAISKPCLTGGYFIPMPTSEYINDKIKEYTQETYKYGVHELFEVDAKYIDDISKIGVASISSVRS